MEYRGTVAVAMIMLVLLSVVGIGIIYLHDQSLTTTTQEETYLFEWAVDVGDIFTFQLIVTGGVYRYPFSDITSFSFCPCK